MIVVVFLASCSMVAPQKSDQAESSEEVAKLELDTHVGVLWTRPEEGVSRTDCTPGENGLA
jgi:hypothetical protein